MSTAYSRLPSTGVTIFPATRISNKSPIHQTIFLEARVNQHSSVEPQGVLCLGNFSCVPLIGRDARPLQTVDFHPSVGLGQHRSGD